MHMKNLREADYLTEFHWWEGEVGTRHLMKWKQVC